MIKLLLDMGLPRRAAADLRDESWDVEHVAERGLATAPDEQLLELAAREGRVVVTLDHDFPTLVTTRMASAPSIIHIRLERVNREMATALLRRIVPMLAEDLSSGCIVSVSSAGLRVRKLPLIPRR